MKRSITSIIAALTLVGLSQVEAGVIEKRGSPHTLTIVNKCSFTIWPALYTSANGPPSPSTTGWQQNSGATYTVTVPYRWNGRVWGRTNCNFSNTGLADCDTGYCVGGLQCQNPGVPPVTLAEFNMDEPTDWYDVSNVDGFNLPISITPSVASCKAPACATNINAICPSVLQDRNAAGQVVGCKSACLEFGSPQYCCTGAYGTSATCPPTNYSQIFKNACPTAYSYAYDDSSSLFTCPNANYVITFCPSGSPPPPHPTTTSQPTTTSTPGTCNGQTYNPAKYVCDGTILCPVSAPNACGGACYSSSQYKCCNGNLMQRSQTC